MKKFLFAVLVLLMSVPMLDAQFRRGETKFLEIGAMGGFANYFGDLSPTPFGKGTIGHNLGLFGRYNFTERVALRGAICFSRVMAADSTTGDEARNLSFRAPITEFTLVPEFSILPFNPREGRRIAPYVYAGISIFSMKPQAKFNNLWYDLQPLGTEGQNINSPDYPLPYKTLQFAVPFGVGVKFAATENLTIGLDFGMRALFTDYLDDVSGAYADPTALEGSGVDGDLAVILANRSGVEQPEGTLRGNPDNKDWLFFGNFTISYNLLDGLGGGGRGCPSF
jgi:hypothetical protein